MAVSYTQTGIIGASIAGLVLFSMLVLLIYLRGRVPFTFSRSNSPSATPSPTSQAIRRVILARIQSDSSSDLVEGEYEKYGELYVAPNQRPTVMAFDIMMRCLLVTGLSGRAKKVDEPRVPEAAHTVGSDSFEAGPHLELNLPRSISFTPSETAMILLSPRQSDGSRTKDDGLIGVKEDRAGEGAFSKSNTPHKTVRFKTEVQVDGQGSSSTSRY
tara:strand:- start:8264 stop:8908 length:645 start_codon:yes stop_codon:yes gene_type:complete